MVAFIQKSGALKTEYFGILDNKKKPADTGFLNICFKYMII